jgi:PAS domain S-box-containing protein
MPIMTENDPQRQKQPVRFTRREWTSLMVIAVLGVLATLARAWQVDARMREILLEQTTLIAWAVRADEIQTLHGDARDLDDARYREIKRQLLLCRTVYPHYRFIYLMRMDDQGRVRFLADSEPENSPDYSPPGQIFEEVSEILKSVFTSSHAATEGPVKDQWGVWVSALAPIYHPYTDALVAVLGVDIDAAAWRVDVWRGALPPALFTVALLGLVLLLFQLQGGWLSRLRWPVFRSHPEVITIAALGLVLTAGLASAVLEQEDWERKQNFRRLAVVRASSFQQLMFRIGDNYLEGIARLFESSNFVDQEEFDHFTRFLLNRPYARAWMWIPQVASLDRSNFERLVQESGSTNYRIWEPDASAMPGAAGKRDVHYPVCYVVPPEINQGAPGRDLAADDGLLEAIRHARETRRTSAAIAAALKPGEASGNLLCIFRPVFHRNDPDQLAGLVAAVLDMNVLLFRAVSRDATSAQPMVRVEVVQIGDRLESIPLAINRDRTEAAESLFDAIRNPETRDGLFVFTAPAFSFGNVYAMLSTPDQAFYEMHRLREGWLAALIGITLTGLIAALAGVLAGRRLSLEEEVRARTREFRQSEESYHGLFNTIQQSIYLQDAQGRFVDVNAGAVARYGHAREAFIGRTPEFLSAPGRNDMEQIGRCFAAAWEGHPQYFEFWGLCKSGEVFPKEVWLYKGTHLGQPVVIAIAADIGERKRAEQENQRLQAQLLQAQKMESIGRLAGGLAHDFNNMIQAMLGNINLARQETAKDSPVAEYLSEIELSARRSARLTGQLLAFASKQTIQPRILDLNDAVVGVLKMLRRLIGEDVQLTWIPGADLWPVKIDPGQIDQILANLTVNARDAISGAGTITIETSNHTCDPERCSRSCNTCQPCQYVVLSVTDNGSGMTAEVQAHAFEPFYTTKTEGKGTGLGLATVFGIVHQNQGLIDLKTAPGEGTTISVMLPRIKAELPPAAPASLPETAVNGTETILLVEDEAAILRMGMISLQRLGYNVLVASNSEDALRVSRAHLETIHLLITDVILPGMNGPDLARRIAVIKPGILCLFMSGYTADVIADRSVLDGTVNFIAKPFSIAELAAKVRTILDQERQ